MKQAAISLPDIRCTLSQRLATSTSAPAALYRNDYPDTPEDMEVCSSLSSSETIKAEEFTTDDEAESTTKNSSRS
jgi:hypothetical protein